MKAFQFVLRAGSLVFFAVGALHLVLGLQADLLLGARIPPEVLADPVLDSQNRFYGVAFTLYGVLLLLCATDLARYSTVLSCVLAVFFAGGCGRLVSIAVVGLPSALVLGLLVLEIVLPPLLALWLIRVRSEESP